MFRYIFITNSYNYYNRIFGQQDLLADYIGESGDIEEDFLYVEKSENLNFNIGDTINTSLVLGRSENPLYEERVGTYLLYCESEEEVPYPRIISRWFILDKTFIRKGQYELQLRRDVYADNIKACREAEAFVERGFVEDSNPLILTQEPVPVNQIKRSETLLKDITNSGWIVGYILRDNKDENGNSLLDESINKINYSGTIANVTIEDVDAWGFYEYLKEVNEEQPYFVNSKDSTQNPLYDYINITFWMTIFSSGSGNRGYYKCVLHFDRYNRVPQYSVELSYAGMNRDSAGIPNLAKVLTEESGLELYNYCKTHQLEFWMGNYGLTTKGTGYLYDINVREEAIDNNKLETLNKLNNNILYQASNGLYYKILFDYQKSVGKASALITDGSAVRANLYELLTGFFSDYRSFFEDENISRYFYIEEQFNAYTLQLEATISVGNFEIVMPTSENRTNASGVPFDMFIIPFSQGENFKVGENFTFSSDNTFSMITAAAIGAKLPGFILDIQLLPYCPISRYDLYNESNGTHVIPPMYSVTYIKQIFENSEQNKNVYAIIWAARNEITFDINFTVTTDNIKIENQCGMYRLVSANYSSKFEFNLAKNGGSISKFNVDLTYLPYSSYVHVNPNFGWLYGSDFNDTRGLIMQGDFSIMYLSDKWAEYAINNKNYLSIFNREIENMDINRKYDVIGQTVDLAASAASGLANSASSALSAGNGAGAVGSLISGVASTAANATQGLIKMQLGELAYQENRSYKKDIFSLNLQNVKAMPNSIVKTTAYTYNNKLFPILEYYTCTEEEKKLFAKYIEKRGMTVGAIGKIEDYLKNWENPYKLSLNEYYYYPKYIKAQIIKIDVNDYLTADTIASEFARGFYIDD